MAEFELEPPTSCDNCSSLNIEFTTNDKLYGEKKGKWPYVYRCLSCNASVSCHPGTNKPMGLMATRRIRQLRTEAHEAFDKLWYGGLMNRNAAYRWLAEQLKIPVECCHISWLNITQLITTITISKQHFEETKHIAERRREKRHAKRVKARDFENNRIRLRKQKGI